MAGFIASQSVSSLALALLLSTALFLPNLSSLDARRTDGFSVELIHRDYLKSPSYNPQQTSTHRLSDAVRRSFNRASHFRPSSVSTEGAEATLTSNSADYLMSISLGTPPFPITAIADTGSDLIWTQCKPCDGCYKQDAPLFDPKSSSTYRDLSCESDACQQLQGSSCSSNDGQSVCQYSQQYGDRSYTRGNVASETITLNSTVGRPVSFPKSVFGCGYDNKGTFNEKGSGIVGLGGGSVSLVSQLGSSVGGKFAYCLVPYDSQTITTSKLSFGSDAVVSGPGVQSTPLVAKEPDTFYYVTLEAISVGSKRVNFTSSGFGSSGEGNIIIDSGTTLTLLSSDSYNELQSVVEEAVQGDNVGSQDGLAPCYAVNSKLKIPVMTAHFTGANVELQPYNTFYKAGQIACFAFASAQDLQLDFSIFGNVAQQNFLVGYDTQAKTVSFKAADCTKAYREN